MSEKTALELVDELCGKLFTMNGGGRLLGYALNIKSAIERERDASEITIDGLEELVKSNTRTIQDLTEQLKSAIVMRPISELPDSVPDGCVYVMVDNHGVTMRKKAYATHFYILPLPKPARRLHPCYMPWCGNEVVVLRDGEDGYRVECRKCGSTGPLRASKEGAKQAWGYAE